MGEMSMVNLHGPFWPLNLSVWEPPIPQLPLQILSFTLAASPPQLVARAAYCCIYASSTRFAVPENGMSLCMLTAAVAPPAPQGWGGGVGKTLSAWRTGIICGHKLMWKRLTGIKLSSVHVGRLTYNSRRRRGSKLIWSWKLTRRRRLIWSRRVTRHRRLARSRRLTRRRRLTWSRRVTRRRRPAWTCWSRRVTPGWPDRRRRLTPRQEGDTTSKADLYQQAAWEDLKH